MAYKLEIINDNDEITEEIFEKQIDIVKKYGIKKIRFYHRDAESTEKIKESNKPQTLPNPSLFLKRGA